MNLLIKIGMTFVGVGLIITGIGVAIEFIKLGIAAWLQE